MKRLLVSMIALLAFPSWGAFQLSIEGKIILLQPDSVTLLAGENQVTVPRRYVRAKIFRPGAHAVAIVDREGVKALSFESVRTSKMVEPLRAGPKME